MNLTALNKICFTVCIVCIVFGVLNALAMIWTFEASPFQWQLLATTAVLFFGSALTLSVSRAFGGRPVRQRDDEEL